MTREQNNSKVTEQIIFLNIIGIMFPLNLERPGGVKRIPPHRFFGPKIWSFKAIKMKLSVPVLW